MTSKAAPLRTAYTARRLDRAGEHRGDMEGTTHAASGLAAGIALAFAAPGPWPHHLGPALVQGLAVGGLALLPDADHPRATFAWTAGWLSRGTAHLVAVLFGGHRQGMHSLPVTAALSALAWWFVAHRPARPAEWAAGAFLAVCVAAGLIATGFARQGAVPLAIGAGVAWFVVTRDPGALWWMIALGMGLHIAEDCCTGYGTALAWPFTRRRFLGSKPRRVMTTKGARTARSKARGGRHARGRTSPRPRAPQGGNGRPPRTPHRTAPWRPSPAFWTEMSPECLDGHHDACTDRGCKCADPRCGHPAQQPKPAAPDPGGAPPF